MMPRRPVRLTAVEWDALVGAVVAFESEKEDDADRAGPDGAEARREIAAAGRALGKVRDTMTTPATRQPRETR